MAQGKAALILLAALAGCATTQAPTVVTVEKPVPVPCVKSVPDHPAYVMDVLEADASDAEIVHGLWAERAQRVQYEDRLRAALQACAAPIQPAR